MASTRTNTATPVQEAATSEKGIELSEEEATFDVETGKPPQSRTSPGKQTRRNLHEHDTGGTGIRRDEPEDDASDAPRASGSSFDEIDDAVKTAKNPTTRREREKAAKRSSPKWKVRS